MTEAERHLLLTLAAAIMVHISITSGLEEKLSDEDCEFVLKCANAAPDEHSVPLILRKMRAVAEEA